MLPNKVEIEASVSNESLMSDYCRFAQTVLSMPLVVGFDADFDVGVKQVDDSPSDGAQKIYFVCK